MAKFHSHMRFNILRWVERRAMKLMDFCRERLPTKGTFRSLAKARLQLRRGLQYLVSAPCIGTH